MRILLTRTAAKSALAAGMMGVLAACASAPSSNANKASVETTGAPAVAAAAAPQSDQGPAAFDPAAILSYTPSIAYTPPEGVKFEATSFISDNVRLTAQWYYAAANAGTKLPTIVMAHGWGGTAAGFRRDAVELAQAGYLVMVFDYRGWGESDARVVLTSARPADAKPGATYAAEVRELREYIDPWEQTQDWFNAIAYALTHSMADPDRLGIRGSSYSGGHVVYVAAHEPRVKALVAQVPGMVGLRTPPYEPNPPAALAGANAAAARLATGAEGYPAPRSQTVGSLIGAPIGAKTVRYSPVEHARQVSRPALFLMAEKEELFANENAGLRACEEVKGPRKAIMIPNITHYGIYNAERDLAIKAAIDWFDRYLKPEGAKTRLTVDRSAPERPSCRAPFERPQGVAAPAR